MSPLRIHHHFIPIKAWRIDCCKRQILSVQESAAKKKQCQLRITKSMTNPLNSKDDRALLLCHISGEWGTGIVSGVG